MKNGKAKKQGGRGKATSPRPVWVDETDAAELPNFEPSPALYNCACAFIWAETERAYYQGDYTLLTRAGFADALEFIANPRNAGTDKAAYSEMLEDYRRFERSQRTRAEYYTPAKILNADFPRVAFWQKFEADKDKDRDALEFRREFLTERWGGLLRLLLTIKDTDIELYNTMTDALIFPKIDTAKNPEPARVRAYFMNNRFSIAGEVLARWLSVAKIPNFEKELAELRERIAENFGIFPAPFECADADGGDMCAPRYVIAMAAKIAELKGNAEKAREAREALEDIPVRRYVRLASDELLMLAHIARAQARQQEENEIAQARQVVGEMQRAQGANGGAANPSGTADGQTVINTPHIEIRAEKVETPAPKEKPAGRGKGLSRPKFAALLHYPNGRNYTAGAIKKWDNNPKVRPTAGGVTYSPELRNDPIAARIWADNFNREKQAAASARKAGLRRY